MMNNEHPEKNLKQQLWHEGFLFLCYTVCLTLFFSAFTTYRTLILAEYHIHYAHYGYNLFEALILSKIILLGQRLKLGERFAGKPLIVPTLYKTLIFSGFVFVFAIGEHFVMGYLHGRKLSDIYQKLLLIGVDQILAEIVIMIFFFVFFFAFLEIGRELGDKKLYQLFFKGKTIKHD